jgi:anaphase-promoting complex subunit 4
MPDAGAFVPERLEIREQSNKTNSDSRRIVILGKDRLHYKVFKFPGADSTRGTAAADEDIPMS